MNFLCAEIFLRPRGKSNNACTFEYVKPRLAMPVPEIPEFEEVLSGIRLAPSSPLKEKMGGTCVPLLVAADETGNARQDAPLWIHYPTETTISFERLLDRIAKELNAAQHSRQSELRCARAIPARGRC